YLPSLVTNTAGPIVSSSMAERMPPWMKPAGLQNSALPSKPTFSQPSHGGESSSRQPSNLADGGMTMSSSAVLSIGASVGSKLAHACCQRGVSTGGVICVWNRGLAVAETVGDYLAHHIRQRFAVECSNRHPAHALWRAGASGHAGRVDHKLQWKMRKDMRDHADLPMPARHTGELGRLFQCGLVVLRRAPVRTRHLGHAAEQSLFRTAAHQKLLAARHDK